MPRKALVALGVAFGLLTLSAPSWGSGDSGSDKGPNGPVDAAPQAIEQKNPGPAPTLPILTLKEVVARTLEKSPTLSAHASEVSAREFDTLQAGLRPNPEFSIEVENVGGSGEFSGTDSAETTARVSQLFELGDKRAQRMEVGRLEKEVAEGLYRVARAEVQAEATNRFVAVLAGQRRMALAGEQVALTGKVLQAVKDRIEAGKTPAIEEVRFQTLVSEARLRRQQIRQELTAARDAMATLWGSDQADFSAAEGPFEAVQSVPPWPQLAALIEESPALALHRTAVLRAGSTLELERADGIPDLTVSLGVKNERDSGDSALVAEIALPLPVFDRNQGAVAAARARRAKAQQEARAARLDLQAQLLESWRKLQSAHSAVEVLRGEIIPAARKSFDGVAYGYQAGKFGFLDVLDAEQSLFQAQSRLIDALAAYHRAVAETERLLGQEILAAGGLRSTTEVKRGQS